MTGISTHREVERKLKVNGEFVLPDLVAAGVATMLVIPADVPLIAPADVFALVDALMGGGYASAHDGLIARKLASVLCGGPGGAAREVTEDEILELEREAFVSLCGEPKSIERMQYMLMNNQPLRN